MELEGLLFILGLAVLLFYPRNGLVQLWACYNRDEFLCIGISHI